MLALKIGCDPEVFLTKGGQPVSAFGLIPGTKKDPHPVHRGTIQVDGMAAEIGIDPATTKAEWLVSTEEVLQQLKQMIPEFELSVRATVEFDPAYLAAQPREARELGCDPDYNAYSGDPNPRPDEHPSMRTGGGHIHLGWCEGAEVGNPNFLEACRALVRQMDFYLCMPSILWDDDQKRRQMYGKPGAFRPKSYGVEYRSLSNKWLENEWLRGWAFDNARDGFFALAQDGLDLFAIHGDVAQKIIDANDKEQALFWCNKLGINTGLRQ